MAKGLTKKQEMFIGEYLTDFNGTRAALSVGCPEKSAHVTASKWIKNPKVRAEIERRTAKRAQKLEITADKVLGELAKLAFFDPRKLFNEDGSPKHVSELDDDTAAAIAGLDIEELYEGRGDERENVGRVRKVKIADKGINLERLGRHLKLFTDKVEATGENGGPIVFQLKKIGDKVE